MKSRLKQIIIRTKIKAKKLLNSLGYEVRRYYPEPVGSKELVGVKVGKFSILLHKGHQLPRYLKNPYYSTNLPRLAVFVREKYSDLRMIDIGANMGDTAALVRSEVFCPIACIEGNEEFFEVLKENTKQFKDVSLFKEIMGDEDKEIYATYKKNIGSEETARISNSTVAGEQRKIKIVKLDTFLTDHPEWKHSKILKIDTDGYDLKIIRGGLDYIKNSKPIIFFEYDPVFFEEQGDNALTVFQTLKNLGYKDVALYDNQGKFILSTDLANELLLKQMHNYIDRNYRTPIPFYDMFIFHKEDEDLAQNFIEKEMKLFYGA